MAGVRHEWEAYTIQFAAFAEHVVHPATCEKLVPVSRWLCLFNTLNIAKTF